LNRRTIGLTARLTLVPLLLGLLGGCGVPSRVATTFAGDSDLSVRNEIRPEHRVTPEFDRAVYGSDSRHRLTAVLLDGDPADGTLRQAVIIRLLWRAGPGNEVAIDPAATNATTHYIVVGPSADNPDATADEVGVYGGAGFFWIDSKPGADKLVGDVWEANLRLADRSERFNDVLTPALLKGDVTAYRDDTETQAVLARLSELISAKLGYPRLVMAE